MGDDLGLSALTDDQLVELARAVSAEAYARGPVVIDAAQAAIQAERDRLVREAQEEAARRVRAAEADRIRREAAEAAMAAYQAAPTQAEKWAQAKTLGMMIVETLGPGWSITGWRNRETGHRRIYLDGPGRGSRGGPKITYLTDGDRDLPPGSLVIERAGKRVDRERVLAICRFAARLWGHRYQAEISASAAARAEIDGIPFPPDYVALRDRGAAP